MEDCIFCKIRDRKVQSNLMYEDDRVMVFPDIHPIRPIHLLVVPKKHIADFLDIEENGILEHMKKIVHQMIRQSDLTQKGYRLIINGGGGQIVNHMHWHIIGPMGKTAKL